MHYALFEEFALLYLVNYVQCKFRSFVYCLFFIKWTNCSQILRKACQDVPKIIHCYLQNCTYVFQFFHSKQFSLNFFQCSSTFVYVPPHSYVYIYHSYPSRNTFNIYSPISMRRYMLIIELHTRDFSVCMFVKVTSYNIFSFLDVLSQSRYFYKYFVTTAWFLISILVSGLQMFGKLSP